MPLLWLSLAFLAGIPLGAAFLQPWSFWGGLAGFALVIGLAGLLLWRRSRLPKWEVLMRPLPWPVLLCALLLGAGRFAASQPSPGPGWIDWYNRTPAAGEQGSDLLPPARVEGIVIAPPVVNDSSTNLLVQVERAFPATSQGWMPVRGRLRVTILPGPSVQYGDRLRLVGQLQAPPTSVDFSYRDYLARQGVYASMSFAYVSVLAHGQGNPFYIYLYALKDRLTATVFRLFPDPEASLMAGILLGDDSKIPDPVSQAFKVTGTAHIIAISGFNITILAAVFIALFGRLFGRRGGALASALGIAFYAVLVGLGASVVRAAIMGGFSLFARQVGRRQDGLNSLAVTAALMAIFTPTCLWDVSFQLSFGATLGLIVYAEPFTQAFVRPASRRLSQPVVDRLVGPVSEYFLMTLAAQVLTTPLMAYYFGRISLVALVANPVVLPVQPAVEILSGLAVLLGAIYLPLGQLVAYLALPCVAFTIRAVEFFATFPYAALPLGNMSLAVIAAIYALILGLTVFAGRLKSWIKLPAVKPGVVVASLGLLAVLAWRAALAAPDGRLHLTYLPAENGDALLIQAPGGGTLLVDGGSSETLLSEALGRRLPFYNRKIDWLVISSGKESQVSALPVVLQRYPPGSVLWAAAPESGRSLRAIQAGLPGDTLSTLADSGQALELGLGSRMTLLSAGKAGGLWLVQWKDFSALLPVGLEETELRNLLQSGSLPAANVLFWPDANVADPRGWLNAVQPRLILVGTVGRTAGFNSDETRQALQGYTLLTTDRNGWVEISTDGTQMWVQAEGK